MQETDKYKIPIFQEDDMADLEDYSEKIANILTTKFDEFKDDLLKFYLKTETYSKSEILELIGNINIFKTEIVESLPEEGLSNVIYLVPRENAEDSYSEYLYTNNQWNPIGSTTIDLSNVYTKQEIDNKLANLNIDPGENNQLIFSWDGESSETNPENLELFKKIDSCLKEGKNIILIARNKSRTNLNGYVSLFTLNNNCVSKRNGSYEIVSNLVETLKGSNQLNSSNLILYYRKFSITYTEEIIVSCSEISSTSTNISYLDTMNESGEHFIATHMTDPVSLGFLKKEYALKNYTRLNLKENHTFKNEQTLAFTAQDIDGFVYDSTTNEIIVQEKGIYMITGQFKFSNSTERMFINMDISNNDYGNYKYRSEDTQKLSGDPTISLNHVLMLAAGTKITFSGYIHGTVEKTLQAVSGNIVTYVAIKKI